MTSRSGFSNPSSVDSAEHTCSSTSLRYHEYYESEDLSDDLKKDALKEIIPPAFSQTVKDVMMFRNLSQDTLSASRVETIIMERIAGDVQDQVIRMDVDQIETRAPSAALLPSQEVDWANSLGYGPQHGAVGKSGFGKVKGKDDNKGNAKGKDYWNKHGPAGAGKGEQHPVGACSFWGGF